MKGRGEYSNLGSVCCTRNEDHVGAEQIFPLLKHPEWRTPTIKHSCPRTILSACLRACSNKVTPQLEWQVEFEKWFRTKFKEDFKGYVREAGSVKVDFDEWLNRPEFPIKYREKIRKALSVDKRRCPPMYKGYEAFPKIEQQFTEVVHELKETSLNKVKERQISGPIDEKKALGNPCIHVLEGVAHLFMKEYCGRQNWVEICEDLEEISTGIINPIWCAADGSGFDMTQLEWVNRLMNELILESLSQSNVTFSNPLQLDLLKKCLEDSLELEVTADNRQLRYKADGRASGDGWTTFGNTMLMIAYWQFCFYKAEIAEYKLKVKGDDVLICLSGKDVTRFENWRKILFTDQKYEHEHGLGQIVTEVKYGDITEMDFLSCHFFRTNDGKLRMTRIPARVVQTISWSTKLPKSSGHKLENSRRQLAYSKGKCLQAWARDLPIWGVLAEKMIELGTPGPLTEFDQYADQPRVWYEAEDRTAYLVYLECRYGILECDVIRAEEQIRGLNTLNGSVLIPLLDAFYV